MWIYDLCLAWNWEYDADFLGLLDAACAARGLTLLNASARNLADVLARFAGREAGFRVLLDRASEANPAYLPLVDIARGLGARCLNPRELADRAYDKASMHRAFLEADIPAPPTIILPAWNDQPDLPAPDLTPLGGSFAVKPALGGGGEGVVTEVTSIEQALVERRQFPEQQYLLQAHVTPKLLDGLPAWFRIIYCLGNIHLCFWDVKTHIYTPVENLGGHVGGHTGPPQHSDPPQLVGAVLCDSPILRNSPIIASLRQVTERIARVCRLDLFSTEIALTEDNRLLVVDYVNDPIDLRLQSKALDGVPDFIVEDIAARIADVATKNQASREVPPWG